MISLRVSKFRGIDGDIDWPAFWRHRQVYGQRSASKYTPHQGERECERRRRQIERGLARGTTSVLDGVAVAHPAEFADWFDILG